MRRVPRVLTQGPRGLAVPTRSGYDSAPDNPIGPSRVAVIAGPGESPVKYPLSLGLALGALWLMWSGHYTSLLLSLGFGSVVVVVVICSRMRLLDREAVPVDILIRLLLYVPWLLWEILKANLDVACRIVDPRLPISPRMIRVRTGQHHDLGRVIYANSITLTPGTVSVSVEGDQITVHALTQSAADGLADGEMNRSVTRLEGHG